MDSITLTFDVVLNVSLQVGDVVHYKNTSTGKIYEIGEVTNITGMVVTCNIGASTPRPEANDFIFFAKNSEINFSGVVGYYASVKMTLAGGVKKELYAVSSEVFQSS